MFVRMHPYSLFGYLFISSAALEAALYKLSCLGVTHYFGHVNVQQCLAFVAVLACYVV